MQERIENILVFGDSLSDRGTMAKSALKRFSGLESSPHGRFTNGYVWLDYFIRQLSLGDDVALVPPQFEKKKKWYAFNTDEYVGTDKAPVLARTYCVGGATAHDYSKSIRPGKCMLNATAMVLENLNSLRAEALEDDRQMGVSDLEKQSTLVIEWTGANDLITVNSTPTMKAAELAVEARINHVQKMIEAGYRHFILFTQPDLALTPRYQNGETSLKTQIYSAVVHFNKNLQERVNELSRSYPNPSYNINIKLFDANALFTDAYDNPERYGFDENKKTEPFLESSEFKDTDPNTTAERHLFWDAVHPTEAVHMILGRELFKRTFEPHYEFVLTPRPAVRQYQKAYGMQLDEELDATCGLCKRASIAHLDERITVKAIIEHGMFEDGKRTRKILNKLHWFNQAGECMTDNKDIQEAYRELQQAHTREIDVTIS